MPNQKRLVPPTDITLRPNPLAILEILLNVGRHLNWNSILTCLRVSKDFHQAFLYHVWATVDIDSYPWVRHRDPTYEELDKHSVMIQKLVVYASNVDAVNYFTEKGGRFKAPRQLYFPNLQSLHLKQLGEDDRTQDRENTLAKMIARHSHLHTFHELRVDSVRSVTLLDAISSCQGLKRLSIGQLKVEGTLTTWMDRYDSLWSRLRTLEIWGGWYSTPLSPEALEKTMARLSNARETELRELRLMSYSTDMMLLKAQQLLLQKSPRLARLRWSDGCDPRVDASPVLTLLTELTTDEASIEGQDSKGPRRRQGLQLLQSLDLTTVKMRSRDLRPLLNNLTSLEEINVTRTTFDIDSWDFMRFSRPRYLTALNVLFLQHCQHVTGTMVQDMLCSMPNLEFFQANYIAASDMARDGRNWVCTGLRELSLDFVVDNVPSTVGGEGPASSAEQEAVESHANRRLHVSEILVLTQLSKQRELEVLEMKSRPSAALPANNAIFNPGNVNHARPPRSDILRLDLQHGLELLQTLSRLRVLSRDDTSTTIEVTWKSNEVKWAMAHWPKLQKLQGFKCTDEAKILLKGYTGLVVQNWRVAEPATRQWW